jgi:glycerol uptake facilitator-like aquaporin
MGVPNASVAVNVVPSPDRRRTPPWIVIPATILGGIVGWLLWQLTLLLYRLIT